DPRDLARHRADRPARGAGAGAERDEPALQGQPDLRRGLPRGAGPQGGRSREVDVKELRMAKKMTKREAASVSWRPTVAGRHYAVSSGHYLATAAAMRVLDAGGNAVDAGVTATFALGVLQPDIVSFAGVAPTLIYLKAENRVISLAGLGYWPAATDVN